MSPSTEIQDALIEEFSLFADWQEKYSHIIDLGRELSPMDPALKDDAHRVKGCLSQVWLHASLRDGKLHLAAESDALIVQGLIAILLRVFQDRTPADILAVDLGFLKELGLFSHLSMSRSNGLQSMVQSIRAHALALQHAG
jgi:cysteine desulfuration protein SufE